MHKFTVHADSDLYWRDRGGCFAVKLDLDLDFYFGQIKGAPL
jgi:hypothetical protein